ncbi:MAG: hypothetical protein HY865_26130 [Chloroflexi bacterium]|nr:hypothetical protein [Chloroflexota bacterium]
MNRNQYLHQPQARAEYESRHALKVIQRNWHRLPWLKRKWIRLQVSCFVCKARLCAWWNKIKTRCMESARNQERVTVGRR